MELAQCDAVGDFVETHGLRGAQRLLALQLRALVGYLACLLLALHHVEGVACGRSTVQTQDDGGLSRACTLDALVALVEHGLDLAPCRTGNDHVALTERTVADEHRRDIATTLVERRLDDAARGLTIRIGLQVEHLSFEQHLLQQLVDTNALLGTDFLTLILAAPLLDQQVHVGQVFAYLVGIGSRLINLVDGKHHRHVGSLGMGDGLLGGRHHRVVGCNDDDGNIGDLSTTGTHGGECLVTRGVEESDLSAVLQFHVVGTDVLRDTTGLTGNHVGIADEVEQRRLTVVDMTHDGHDRSTTEQVVLVVGLLGDGFLHFSRHIFGGEAELLGHEVDGLRIQALVDAHHDAHRHAGADDLDHRHVHHRGQFADGDELGELEHLALCCLRLHLLVHALGHGIAFLLTILGAFLVLSGLRGEAGQRLLNLTCHVLLVHLNGLHRLTVVLLTVLLAATLLIIVLQFAEVLVATLVLLLVAATLLVLLFGSCLDVDLIGADALALALLAVLPASGTIGTATLLSGLLLALLALLLLRLLLGTGALVERREVYLAQHIHLGCQLGLALEGVDLWSARGLPSLLLFHLVVDVVGFLFNHLDNLLHRLRLFGLWLFCGLFGHFRLLYRLGLRLRLLCRLGLSNGLSFGNRLCRCLYLRGRRLGFILLLVLHDDGFLRRALGSSLRRGYRFSGLC